MNKVHPKAYWITEAIHSNVAMGWKKSEEDELIDGIQFMRNHVCVDSVSTFDKLIKEVAMYLTITLNEKANEDIIRRKLRHLTDVYRHFKMFIFLKPGVSYNDSTNEVRVGPKYWKLIEQENELDAYFRIHGFRLYDACCQILDYGEMAQFSSYIDEDVHMNIPLGIKLPDSNVFHYLKHRAAYPLVKKSDANIRYKNIVWTIQDYDNYFFTNGWDFILDGEFIHRLLAAVNERIIEDEDSYEKMIYTLANEYGEFDDPQLSIDGIREKIRSTAYLYKLFKRFVFKTVGVEFNFHLCYVRVNNVYWKKPGKEPQYMWFFRTSGFSNYEECYHVFDVMELDRFAYGPIDVDCIDPATPKGVEVSVEDNVFKSYYQDD